MRLTMELRLITYILAVVALVAASMVAMADQSGKLIGAHEIPSFVLERIELTPGVASQPPRKPDAS
jgi:hypothetical protein